MRSLNPDSEYFEFLDELRDNGAVNTVLAAAYLVREFPGLRSEEAKAICTPRALCRSLCSLGRVDWRATYHERRTRPSPS